MATLKFNRVHKNGWFSYKIDGVAGAVFVDSRMLSEDQKGTMPATLEVELGFLAPGANASDAQREKAEKKAANDAKKAEKATASAAKAAERLQKLQDKANAALAKAQAIAAKSAPVEATQ